MRAYERFLQYVAIHTTSSETTGTHPSFDGEFVLAERLRDELIGLGLKDVRMDGHAYVYGMLPATEGCENMTPLGFIAHMDTSDEASGKNVKAVMHKDYDGGDVVLSWSKTDAATIGITESGNNMGMACDNPNEPETIVMKASDFSFLQKLKGETLITSDGTTLLGADDKAGIAEIMTAFERIISGKLPHRELWVAFTPDEEIGEGADLFDLNGFGAKYAFTVDGGDVNCLEYENFNAASADVIIKGFSVHPGDAKDVMINASNVAMEFHQMLPEAERPEHTEKREGFFHLVRMGGRTSEAELHYIIRDHDRMLFEKRKEMVRKIGDRINEKYGQGTAMVVIEDSYYNMREKIEPHMQLVEKALEAIKSVGLEPEIVPIRGGTDGARLSYEGLPCPNLGTGGFNFHGNYECITVERMDRMVEIISYLGTDLF